MTTHVIHCALILALLSLLPSTDAVSPTPAGASLLQALQAYEAAANRHDTRALAPLIADDVVIELGDGLRLVGREEAERLHEWERTLGSEIHYTDCRVTSDAVTCRASERNDFLRVAGLSAITYDASTITFERGRVVRMSATLSDESASLVGAYMQGFLTWADHADPKALGTFLKPDGSFAFGHEPALAFKRLLRTYAQARAGASRAL